VPNRQTSATSTSGSSRTVAKNLTFGVLSVRTADKDLRTGLEDYSPPTLHSGYRRTPRWSSAAFRRESSVE
jgi:hypothetical protein